MLPLDGARIASEKPSRRVPLKQLLLPSRYISLGNVVKFGDAAFAPPPPPRPKPKRDDYRYITYYLHPATAFPGGAPSADVVAIAVKEISAGIAAAFPAAEVEVRVVDAESSAGIGFDRSPRSYSRLERDQEAIHAIAKRAIAAAAPS